MRSLLLIFIFFVGSFSDVVAVAPIKGIPLELLLNADAVVRNSYTEVILKTKKKSKVKVLKVITIFKENDLEDLVIGYDGESDINVFKGIVYDENGKVIRKIDKKGLRDYANNGISLISDRRVKYVDFSYSQYPYTIEYSYEYTINKSEFLFIPQINIQNDFNVSIQNMIYKITFPEDLELLTRPINCKYEPTIDEEGWKWDIHDVKAIKKEKFTPVLSTIFPKIEIKVKDFIYDGYKGSWENWKTYGDFLYTLHKDRQFISEELKTKLTDLTSNCQSDDEKVSVLYKYLQNNYRYVSISLGIGGWQPFSALDVEKSKYGDCKGLSNFMYTILREVGVDSHPAVIYSSDIKRFTYDTLSTNGYFNHEILYLPKDDKWLECTSTSSAPNYINYSNSNRKALLLTPDGGQLVDTPVLDEDDNVRTSKSTITINQEGKYSVNANIKLKGEPQEFFRVLPNYDEQIQEKYILKLLDNSLVHLEDYAYNIKDNLPHVNVGVNFSMVNTKLKNGITFSPFPFFSKNKVPKEIKIRTHDLSIQHAYTELDTLIFNIGLEYDLIDIPAESILDSEYGFYSLKFDLYKDNVIRVIRKKVNYRIEKSKEHYNLYRDFQKKISKLDRMKLYFSKKK